MSCGCCNSNPCNCEDSCDPAHEPLASALDNFITAFFGSVTKTCVNGKVAWALPCDLNDGIPGYPRLPNEGIACYLLRIWGTCNCSFLTLTDTPDSYAGQSGKVVAVNGAETGLEFVVPSGAGGCRGFPSAQAVWLDLDAALQTPCGQPAFTTAQAAYVAADALQILSGIPVVIMVGRGSGVEFGGITTAGADWNPDVSISGLGRNISSIDAISTSGLISNSASGDLNLKVNGCSFDTAIATFTMDASGTFDAGDVTLDGDDCFIPIIYAAAPAGGGNGGDVTIADGSGIISGAIITQTSTALKSSGSLVLGLNVVAYYAGVSTGGASGTAGNVTMGDNSKLLNGGIDAFAFDENGGTVIIGDNCFVGGPVTTSTSTGTGGSVTVGKNSVITGATSTQSTSGVAGAVTTGADSILGSISSNSSGANGPSISINGIAGNINGQNTAGAFAGATISIGESGITGVIDASSAGGVGGPVNVDVNGFCESITSTSFDANGPTIQMNGICLLTINGDTTSGNFLGATILVGNGTEPAASGPVTSNSTAGTGGFVTISNRSSSGNITSIGIIGGVVNVADGAFSGNIVNNGTAGNGGDVFVRAGAYSGFINANGAGGNGGNILLVETATSGEITTESTGGFNGGQVIVGVLALVRGNVSTVSDTAISGSVILNSGGKINGDLDISATTGTAGSLTTDGSNHVFAVNGTATTGTAALVTIGSGSDFGTVDISHAAGTNGSFYAENSTFENIICNSVTSGGGTGINLLNCVVSNLLDGSAGAGAQPASITIRSGSIQSIDVDALGGASTVVNISAAYVAGITGTNTGGAQPSLIVINASDVGDVDVSGSAGSPGGLINADSSKIGNVDVGADPGDVSGQIRARNTRFGNIIITDSSNQIYENCVFYGQLSNIGFISKFINCSFESTVANSDCIAEIFSDGAYFFNCGFRPNGTGFPIQSSAPHTINAYDVLTKNAFAPNVGFTVANFIVDAGF